MLVLKINEGERIKIGDNVELLFKWGPDQHSVGVCIDAPRDVKVSRIHEDTKTQKS